MNDFQKLAMLSANTLKELNQVLMTCRWNCLSENESCCVIHCNDDMLISSCCLSQRPQMITTVQKKRLSWYLPWIKLSSLEQLWIETTTNVTTPDMLPYIVVHSRPMVFRLEAKRCLVYPEMSVKIMVLC